MTIHVDHSTVDAKSVINFVRFPILAFGYLCFSFSGITFLFSPFHFITSSIDQRLILWSCQSDTDEESDNTWQVVVVKHTSVADISAVTAFCPTPDSQR